MKSIYYLTPLIQDLTTDNWLTSPGVIGTIALILIVIFLGIFIFIKRLTIYVDLLQKNNESLSDQQFERRLINLDEDEVDAILELRKQGFETKKEQKKSV